MNNDKPRQVVVEFHEAINRQDRDGLAALMTDDHAFIDSANKAISGKDKVLEAWGKFFEAFPDYRNTFEYFVSKDNRITVLGKSSCSDSRLHGPAIWTAAVRGSKIAEWRVYDDTLENRKLLGIETADEA
jgi:ketosteroid isomerase-like protein